MKIDLIDFTGCKNEQQFKMKYLKETKDTRKVDIFCIETEETVKGFPDVLIVNKEGSGCGFEEFKYTKSGKIKFQPTQPAFYMAHPWLSIWIVAYNAKSKRVHCIYASELFQQDSYYPINEKGEVDLCKAEKKQAETIEKMKHDIGR